VTVAQPLVTAPGRTVREPLPESPDLTAPDPVAPVQRQALGAPGADGLPPVDDDLDGNLVAPGAATAPPLPGAAQPVAGGSLQPVAPNGQLATLTPPRAPQVQTARPPAPAAPPSSSRVVGSWKVAEQNGTNCKLNLSSAPFVDLSRASTSGCSPSLARVNAWRLEGSEVVLYETGGSVAARLRGGGGSFNGAAVKTGAPISINR
jgi:Protease inhibitor Inh